MRVILLSLVYPLQYPVVRFVQGLRQSIKILSEIWWEAMSQRVQLAEYPPEPVRRRENVVPESNNMTHIPSALSVSVSITIFLSSALHLLIAELGDEFTMFRTYSAMSAF